MSRLDPYLFRSKTGYAEHTRQLVSGFAASVSHEFGAKESEPESNDASAAHAVTL